MYGRTAGSDPNPTTANANPSNQVVHATNSELSDNDIAGISSGASINRTILPGGTLVGLSNNGAGAGLGAGSSASHAGGAGIAGTVNNAISRGLAPLDNLGSMAGGR